MKLTDARILDLANKYDCATPGDEHWEFSHRDDLVAFARSIADAAAAPVVHRAAEQEGQPIGMRYRWPSHISPGHSWGNWSAQFSGSGLDPEWFDELQRRGAQVEWVYAASLSRASDAAAQIMDAALTDICNWPDGGNRYGQGNIKAFAKDKLNEARRLRFNGVPQQVAETTQDVAQGDERTALQWTSGTLQAIVAGRWRDVKEMDKVSAGAVVKTIAEVLDMADAALARATTPQPDPLVASSETLRKAIENHSRFAAGLAFGLADLARKRGMGGNGSMQEAMAADAARAASSTAEIERRGEGE